MARDGDSEFFDRSKHSRRRALRPSAQTPNFIRRERGVLKTRSIKAISRIHHIAPPMFIYTCDKLPCNEMAQKGGEPRQKTRAVGVKPYCRCSTAIRLRIHRRVEQHSEFDQLGHAAHMQLFHKTAAMFLDCLNTEPQLSRHDFIRIARDDEFHYVAFAFRQCA